jgi:hypothetical protein
MRNVLDKSCKENPNTHFVFSNFNFFFIVWKHITELDLPQMTIWRMHIACWIPKAKNILSEYAIITAFPLQRRLHARPSMSRYMCIACQVTHYILLQKKLHS